MQVTRKPLPTLTGNEKNIGFLYLIFQLFFLPVLLQLLGSVFFMSMSATLLNFIYFSVNLACVLVIFSKFLTKSLLRCRKNPREVTISAVLGFLAYWLCSTLVGMGTQILFPEFVNLNDGQLVAIFGDYPLLLVLGTVFFAPVAEEVLHRGLVFGTLVQKNVIAGYLLSALVFAAIHVVQYVGLYSPGYMLLALMQYLPSGLIFAWAYHRSGCILAPMAIHAANNAIAILLMR